MKVYYADKPANHHFFIRTVDELGAEEDKPSLLRLDKHSDHRGLLPYSNYVSKIECYFMNVVWFNKPEVNNFTVYPLIRRAFQEAPQGFQLFESLDEAIDCLCLNQLKSRVVVDVDPDIVKDYECQFDTGEMSLEELSKVISHVNSNFEVLYFFFASPKSFAEQVFDNAGIADPEFIHLREDQKVTSYASSLT